MRHPIAILIGLAVLSPSLGPRAHAELVIHLVNQGGFESPDVTGGGNLVDIVQAAAEQWERAFSDPSGGPWEVTIGYEWATLKTTPAGNTGRHYLISQGGKPVRETQALVQFDNSAFSPWFADPDPRHSTAYTDLYTPSLDFADTPLNVGRVYQQALGDAVGRFDMLTLALHEIGHALGMSADYVGFQEQVKQNFLTFTIPPYEGSLVRMVTDHFAELDDALMGPRQQPGYRYLISGLDVLANAQLSQFDHPNLDPYAVPEPAAALLLASGLVSLAAVRARLGRRPRGTP